MSRPPTPRRERPADAAARRHGAARWRGGWLGAGDGPGRQQTERNAARNRLAPADLGAPSVLAATVLGTGFLPWMPGTWGALLGALIWWFALAGAAATTQLVAVAVLVALSLWLLSALCARRALGDDPAIVIDEVCGVWVALLFLPRSLAALAAGFALFRLFDIAKPWPVSWAERAPGGLGVLLDDLCAGALALATLQAGLWVASSVGAAG